MNGGTVENSNKIKDENGRSVLEEAEVQRIWNEYYEDLYNIDTQEQVAVHMCGFDGVRRGNYYGEWRLEVRVGKLNGKLNGMERLQVRMKQQEI